MKHKFIYTLFLSCILMGGLNAQMECATSIEVILDEDGNGEILASNLVPEIEFYLANGTVSYFILPFISGVFESGDDIININCNSAWTNIYIVEYTQGDDLIESCSGSISVLDPLDGCPNYSNYCEDLDLDCDYAINGYSIHNSDFNPIPAERFALCSNLLNCSGEYLVAIGHISDAATLNYDTHINSEDVEKYITSVVLSYTENGATFYDNSTLYVWENLDCFLIPRVSRTIDMDITGESVIVPSMFLKAENTCTQLTMAVTDVNEDVPTDFFGNITLDCDDLGYHTVYLKDEETGMIASSELFLADPLEACGPILGSGDKLISMSNNPPAKTYSKTQVSLNGITLPSSTTGKGWIINEDDLVNGVNALNFDSGPFSLNGITAVDFVLLMKLIVNDEYDTPIQSIAMDVDNSGYNGIGDLIMIRNLILAIPIEEDPSNILFKSKEFQIPSDFNPFDFDYDFTKYEFEKSDFENLSFKFEAYKVGDFNGTAAVEDSLKTENVSTTRDLDLFEVSDLDVVANEPFSFTLSYNNGGQIKGLLAAIVSNGVKFESMISDPSDDVLYNIIDDTEIRISYITPANQTPVDKISFEISAVSNKSGKLIDLLGLKSGFPQEVINDDDEVFNIDDIEESSVTSVVESDLLDLKISIYPNPVNNTLKISTLEGGIGKLEILDPMGKRVLSRSSDLNEMQIDVSQLENGIYYISIENSKNISNRPFIKI